MGFVEVYRFERQEELPFPTAPPERPKPVQLVFGIVWVANAIGDAVLGALAAVAQTLKAHQLAAALRAQQSTAVPVSATNVQQGDVDDTATVGQVCLPSGLQCKPAGE